MNRATVAVDHAASVILDCATAERDALGNVRFAVVIAVGAKSLNDPIILDQCKTVDIDRVAVAVRKSSDMPSISP